MKPLAISNACDRPISAGGASPIPNAETALYGVLQPTVFIKITKRQDPQTFKVLDLETQIQAMASIQPLKVRELAIKPEGERRWTWLKIYADPHLRLAPSDVIKWEGQRYRVMATKPWAANGYMYYEVVNDYVPGVPSTLVPASASPSGYDL